MNLPGRVPPTPHDWTVRAARADDHDAIIRLVYSDPDGDTVKLVGTTERALRFGNLVASAWRGASWSASTIVEAQGAVVAVLQDGPGADEFGADRSFVRQVVRELGFVTALRALPAGVALQLVRIPLPDDSWLIHELHVDATWRNRGIGALLLRHAADRGTRHGLASAALSTRTNNPARHLYERLGYRVVTQRTSRLYAHFTGSAGRVLMTTTLRSEAGVGP